jgi:hypothetical protein
VRVEIDGGRPVALAKINVGCGASWGKEAIVYCSAVNEGLRRVSPSGGESSPVTQPAEAERHSLPNFLPDGRRFTYLSYPAAGGPATLRLADLDGKADRPLFAADSKGFYAEDRLFFLRGNTLLARSFDARSGDLGRGEAEIVVEGVDAWRGGQFTGAAGLLAFTLSEKRSGTRVTIYDRAGKDVARIDSDTFLDDLVLSPDGRQAALMKAAGGTDASSDSADVWLLDLERQIFSRATFGDFDDDPVFSPDGAQLAYAHRGDLYRKPANGPGEPKLLADSPADIVTNDWTADGWIVYSDVDGAGEDLLAVRAEGGEPQRLTATPFREYDAQVSPTAAGWHVSDEAATRRST